MDARYESLEQKTLNELICCLNQCIQNNMSEILEEGDLHRDLVQISTLIYLRTDIDVNSRAILSRKNLLSIDPVLFPSIDELLIDQLGFKALLEAIKALIENKKTALIYKEIEHHLQNYPI